MGEYLLVRDGKNAYHVKGEFGIEVLIVDRPGPTEFLIRRNGTPDYHVHEDFTIIETLDCTGAVVQPPPGGTVPPPVTMPPNPGAIVPPWGDPFQAYPRPGYQFRAGQVAAFQVPVNPYTGDSVGFTVGQTPSQAARVHMQIYLSQQPGVIFPPDTANYERTNEGGFANAFGARVYQRESGFNTTGRFKAFPGEVWYMNMVCDVDSVHSIQWSP